MAPHSGFFFMPVLLIWRSKFRKYLLLFFGLTILAGCFQKFYRTGSTDKIDAARIQQLAATKYFIIHYADAVMKMEKPVISGESISASLSPLSGSLAKNVYPNPDEPNVLKGSSSALSEVHLYTKDQKITTGSGTDVLIPLKNIYRLDVYEYDEKATRNSATWSTVGLIAVVAAGIIIVAIASSGPNISTPSEPVSCACPAVYMEQKGNFAYVNSMYSGALYRNLERPDYLTLGQLSPRETTVQLRIAGHDEEIQYINSVQLQAVQHQPGTRVLADANGNVLLMNNPVAAMTATGDDNSNLLDRVGRDDGQVFAFNTYGEKENFSHAFLSFTKKPGADNATLLVKARNSNWAAQMNQEFINLFGNDYNRFREREERKSVARMQDELLAERLPLHVYIEKNGQWELAGYYPLTGSEGFRDMVMNLDLRGTEGPQVRIKLETAYRFWDLDYAAIDFTGAAPLPVTSLQAVSVQHSVLGSQENALAASDKQYTILKNNETIHLQYKPAAVKNGLEVTYILQSSGYYHDNYSIPVTADRTTLKRYFKKPGGFDTFSRDKFREVEQLKALVQNK